MQRITYPIFTYMTPRVNLTFRAFSDELDERFGAENASMQENPGHDPIP
jgi:hypothetical protein